jgi:uncharacterized protein (TIGR00730 family)
MKKTITVFGSSLPAEDSEEFFLTYKLGGLLAKNGFDVCTGGFQGIMNAVSKGAVENGGKAIGVTVDLWGSKPSEFLTENIKCKTLFERISKLVELGDAYVILQGGTGTLLELAVVWEFMNKRMLKTKPIICHSKMWKDIVNVLDKQLEHEKRPTDFVKCFETVEEIVEYLKRMIK